MTKKVPEVLTCLLVFIFMVLFANQSGAQDVSRMTKEDLKSMMENSQVVVIDVRTGRDWNGSQTKIKGAVREEPKKARAWADKYDKQKTYVLYCA